MTMDAVIERAKRQSARLGHNYVGTEHALLAIVDDEPALLEPYGVTRQNLLQVLTVELVRIVGELRVCTVHSRTSSPGSRAVQRHGTRTEGVLGRHRTLGSHPR